MNQQFELIRWTAKAQPALVDGAIKMVQGFPFPDLINSYKELGAVTTRKIPTKIVWGNLSKYFPTRENVHNALPNAEVETLEDAGHMLFVEKRDEVNEQTYSFLK